MTNDNTATTDPFTEAARAEAKRSALSDGRTAFTDPSVIEDLLVHMAEWARTHLAAQEPTDAEVHAAARALHEDMGGLPEELEQMHLDAARAALSAARKA